MKQKTITIKIAVPDWAKWVATDDNGNVWHYECRPLAGMGVGAVWWPEERTRLGYAGKSIPPADWRKTLRRIK